MASAASILTNLFPIFHLRGSQCYLGSAILNCWSSFPNLKYTLKSNSWSLDCIPSVFSVLFMWSCLLWRMPHMSLHKPGQPSVVTLKRPGCSLNFKNSWQCQTMTSSEFSFCTGFHKSHKKNSCSNYRSLFKRFLQLTLTKSIGLLTE